MKKSMLFLLIGVFAFTFFSCEKKRIRKAYEECYGLYITEPGFTILDKPGYDTIISNELSIGDEGAVLYYDGSEAENQPSCNFSVSVSENPNYDYKLYFEKTLLFTLNIATGEMVEAVSPPKSVLNDGRSFYLKRVSDNSMLFIVVHDAGSIDTYTFTK